MRIKSANKSLFISHRCTEGLELDARKACAQIELDGGGFRLELQAVGIEELEDAAFAAAIRLLGNAGEVARARGGLAPERACRLVEAGSVQPARAQFGLCAREGKRILGAQRGGVAARDLRRRVAAVEDRQRNRE